ncbi:DUF4189 domain-containing protein [Pseudomonas quasicaspiana]|nr:DUF4189 domain-containing protein [Pseudomonas quasicaspiana]
MFKISIIISCLIFVIDAKAEQGCPPGQYPIGGQGAIACAPLPQQSVQQQPRPSGKWIKTWGAIAMGSSDSIPTYGVTTGKLSKDEAEEDALNRCASRGQTNCQIGLSYKNQCAAVAEPQINGNPFAGGISEFMGHGTVLKASDMALERCKQHNKSTPSAECKVIYTACSEPIFENF